MGGVAEWSRAGSELRREFNGEGDTATRRRILFEAAMLDAWDEGNRNAAVEMSSLRKTIEELENVLNGRSEGASQALADELVKHFTIDDVGEAHSHHPFLDDCAKGLLRYLALRGYYLVRKDGDE